jgi:hypothetical protein
MVASIPSSFHELRTEDTHGDSVDNRARLENWIKFLQSSTTVYSVATTIFAALTAISVTKMIVATLGGSIPFISTICAVAFGVLVQDCFNIFQNLKEICQTCERLLLQCSNQNIVTHLVNGGIAELESQKYVSFQRTHGYSYWLKDTVLLHHVFGWIVKRFGQE